jgi:hypothetical protein
MIHLAARRILDPFAYLLPVLRLVLLRLVLLVVLLLVGMASECQRHPTSHPPLQVPIVAL